jgi:hypothetical protein
VTWKRLYIWRRRFTSGQVARQLAAVLALYRRLRDC